MSEQFLSPVLVTAPTLEPITLCEAKKHLEIAESDYLHDDYLTDLIQQAREQWEMDTDTCCINQTLRVQFQSFPDGLMLPRRPIQSITSIQYYDGANTLQTLATSIYQLDAAKRRVRFAYQQTLPATAARWDAWQITYVAGYGSTAASVPSVAKQAMKLLIGSAFEFRESTDNKPQAYEALVMKFMRSTYP